MAADGLLVGLSVLGGVVLGPLGVLLIPLTVGLAMWIRGAVSPARIGLALFCVLIGVGRAELRDARIAIPDLERSDGAVGIVRSLPVAGGRSERVVLRLESLTFPGDSTVDVAGQVLAFLPEGRSIGPGDRLTLRWSADALESLPPGYASFVSSQDASGSAQVWSYRVMDTGPGWLHWLAETRRSIASSLQDALPGDAGALAAGIVTGDDSALSPEAEEAFRRTGTSHVTAVSGQNVGLLIAFCSLSLRPRRPWTRIATHIGMIVLVWGYALMVGLEAPALRAAVVATLTIAETYTGRRPDPLTLLALALGGMVLVEPQTVQRAGFWLSASASLALCSVMRVEGEPNVGQFMRQSVLSVLAASVATIPILLVVFGEWSMVGPLANLLISPLLTLTFPATYVLAIAATLSPAVGQLLAWIPGLGLDATLAIVHRLVAVAPMARLEVTSPIVAGMVAVPCVAVLIAVSRDGVRWMRLLDRRWRRDRQAFLTAGAGVLAGACMALIVLSTIWH